MDVFWFVAQPWDPVAGAAKTVRATSCDLTATCTLGNEEYLPVMADGPSFSTTIFDGAAVSSTPSTRGAVEFAASLGEIDDWAQLIWASRPVQIYRATINVANPAYPGFPPNLAATTKIFDGMAESIKADKAVVALAVRQPVGRVAYSAYEGTGGIAGNAKLKGTTKPWASGLHINRSPVLVDPGLLLYQVHGYGAIEGFDRFRERGITLDQAIVSHANIASLIAATVPATEIHICLAAGAFRLGFQPTGSITADFRGDNAGGYSARLGNIIQRLLTGPAGWPLGSIDTASLASLNTDFAHDAWCFDDRGSDVLDAISSLLNPIGAYWDIDELGVFYTGTFRIKGTADFTVAAEGQGTHDLSGLELLPTRAPFWRNRMAYAFNPTVFDTSDLPDAIGANLSPAGKYTSGTVYGFGDIVEMPDGSLWSYSNTLPSAGVPPPTGTHWSAVAQAPLQIEAPLERVIKCDYTGAALAGQLPDVFSIRVSRGNASIKLANNVSYRVDSESNVGSTVNNTTGSASKGDVTVTSVSSNDSGVTNLVVSVDGLDILPVLKVRYRKELGPAPTTGAAGTKRASVDPNASVSSTSYTVISPVSTLTVASGEKLYTTAPLDYLIDGSTYAARTATAKAEYRLLPSGAWTDFGAGITGSTAESGFLVGSGEFDYIDPVYGHVDVNQTATGLAAGDYEVRVSALLNATGRTAHFIGTILIEAKP